MWDILNKIELIYTSFSLTNSNFVIVIVTQNEMRGCDSCLLVFFFAAGEKLEMLVP